MAENVKLWMKLDEIVDGWVFRAPEFAKKLDL